MKKIVAVCFLLVVLMSGNNVFAGFVSGDHELKNREVFAVSPNGTVSLFYGAVPANATHVISGTCSYVELGQIPSPATAYSVKVREGKKWVSWPYIITDSNPSNGNKFLSICVKPNSATTYFQVVIEIPFNPGSVVPTCLMPIFSRNK